MAKVSNIFKKMIDSKKIISFDVFDTLIKRNCLHPTDIFKIIEKRYNLNNDEKISGFFEKRIEAEKRARKHDVTNEVDLDDIYNYIDYDYDVLKKLKKLELEVELEYCCRNEKMYEIYNYCKSKNKKIICVSDMYLNKNQIQKILKKCNYDIDTIYVSCDIKKSKIKGDIFNYIIEKNKWKKKDILHIGDSYKADFISPLLKKIKCIHINKYQKNTVFFNMEHKKEHTITSSIIKSLINNNSLKINNYYEKLGYEVIGPICCSMIYWIRNEAQKNKIDNLLFCARDMKFIQYIYELYFGKEEIKNSYFYVSRKSTYLPFLYKKSDYKFFEKFIPVGRRKIKITELLELYNLDISHHKIKEYGLDLDAKYDLEELRKDKKFIKYYNDIIKCEIQSKGKEQYENFLKYLNSLSVNCNTALVDLGWRGSTQKIMMDILENDLYGMYFGIHHLIDNKIENKYSTFLFNIDDDYYSNKVYSFMTLIELIFSSTHGSTIGYSNKDNKPYILGKSANEKNECIESIQKGIIKFSKDLLRYKDDIEYEKNNFFVDKLMNIGTSPTLKQAKQFGKIYTENLKTRALAQPKKLTYYIFHLKQLKNDLMDSEWKIGFLKQLFVIKLPYYKIYNFLKRN